MDGEASLLVLATFVIIVVLTLTAQIGYFILHCIPDKFDETPRISLIGFSAIRNEQPFRIKITFKYDGRKL
jgi:hypothetical protein